VAAPAREHAGQHEPGQDHGAGEVEVEDAFDVVLGEVVELALWIAAGVVDQDVDRTELALDGVDDRAPVLGRGDISGECLDIAACRPQRVGGRVQLCKRCGLRAPLALRCGLGLPRCAGRCRARRR